MPEATVYQCDKTEGLNGDHRKCGREVGADGVRLFLTIAPIQAKLEEVEPTAELQFCCRRHAQYWLIRQRLA